jgi:hypothetical protein
VVSPGVEVWRSVIELYTEVWLNGGLEAAREPQDSDFQVILD